MDHGLADIDGLPDRARGRWHRASSSMRSRRASSAKNCTAWAREP